MDQEFVLGIRSRYEQVCAKIEVAARSVGRDPASVRLVVVTKTHPLETVRAVLDAGIRELGENYAEEAVEKIKAVGDLKDLTWHMIGHVQSRKADLISYNFDLLHSLDSQKLANRLDRFAREAGRRLPVLLECNVSGEVSKFGFSVFDPANWLAFCSVAESIARLPNLEIRGLMTMPPLYSDPEKTRPFFRRLRELKEYLSVQVPQVTWNELSMGTSADFMAGIQEGATLVRVGTAILGARSYVD